MNVFFWADVVSLVFLLFVMVFFLSFKNHEESKYHPMINAVLSGIFFVMVYFLLGIVSSLMAVYNMSAAAVDFSAVVVVLPISSIFFLVSVLLSERG
ncbi:MAG: hypothetical protein ABIH63_03920 [archaeon]